MFESIIESSWGTCHQWYSMSYELMKSGPGTCITSLARFGNWMKDIWIYFSPVYGNIFRVIYPCEETDGNSNPLNKYFWILLCESSCAISKDTTHTSFKWHTLIKWEVSLNKFFLNPFVNTIFNSFILLSFFVQHIYYLSF